MMKIAFDISPLHTGHFRQHQVRGSGFYVQHLQKALEVYEKDQNFAFFINENSLPRDIDLIHYPYFEPFFLTLPRKKITKTVVTIHDVTPLVFPKAFPSGIKGRIRWLMQKNALQNIDQIITDSEASKKDIARLTGMKKEKISVIYLAASEDFRKITLAIKEKEELIKKYSLPELFILYVGDATWNKNLPRIVQAAEIAKTPLIMVGKALVQHIDTSNPWNKDLIFVQNRTRNNPFARRIGYIPTDDLVQLYTLASALVFPSLYEGFGLPILEAMATGCPVITSKEGSLPEVAGDAAYFCDAYSIDNIADAIKAVTSSRSIQNQLREKGFTHAKNFSWKNVADETVAVYKKTLKI